jgi:hypothetical protein
MDGLAGDLLRLIYVQMCGYRHVLRMTCRRLYRMFPQPSRKELGHFLWEMCARSDAHMIRWWCFMMPTCMLALHKFRNIMATTGNVPIMRWAMAVGRFGWDPEIMILAAMSGNYRMLDLALDSGNADMHLSTLVGCGSVDVMRWAYQRHLTDGTRLMKHRLIWDYIRAVQRGAGSPDISDLLEEWNPDTLPALGSDYNLDPEPDSDQEPCT